MNETADQSLTRDEALEWMERLLQGVAEDRLPLVAAQAVWGMGPWSSRTGVVRVMAGWVARRFGEALPALPRALVMAACARADLADRRFVEAIEGCEAAVEEAGRCGDERVLDACRALLARALLQNGEVGRGLKVLEDVPDADLPPALRPEVLLARGVAEIVRGDPDQAAEQFSEAGRVAEAIEQTPGSTAQWHKAMALAGEAHARMRGFWFGETLHLLEAARSLALDNDAHREAADLALLIGVAGVATGRADAEFAQAIEEASRVQQAVPGMDFLVGLPADLAGCRNPAEAASRLEQAAAERLTVRDEAGFLVAALACAGLYARAGSPDTALRILDLAHEAASNLEWTRTLDIVVASKKAISR